MVLLDDFLGNEIVSTSILLRRVSHAPFSGSPIVLEAAPARSLCDVGFNTVGGPDNLLFRAGNSPSSVPHAGVHPLASRQADTPSTGESEALPPSSSSLPVPGDQRDNKLQLPQQRTAGNRLRTKNFCLLTRGFRFSRLLLQLLFNQLPAVEFHVVAICREQFAVGSALHNRSVAQHDDLIGVLHRGDPM